MDWFKRHLNWSLFFGSSLLPLVVNMIFWAVLFAVFWGQLAPFMGSGMDGFSEDVVTSMLLQTLPVFIILILVNLALAVFAFIVVWWYLGKKARSKWFLLLVIVPGVLAGIFRGSNLVIELLISIAALVCIIILYCLENRAIGYGGDFVGEPVADHWRPDTGQFGTTDDWQPKELDYRPAKNLQDVAYGGAVKDVGDVGAPSGEVPAAFPPQVAEETPPEVSAEIPPEVPPEVTVEIAAESRAEVPPETPAEFSVEAVDEVPTELLAEAKVIEEAVRHETLQMPILLDDAGAVIKCFYHPDADAVNRCSRCRRYVCSQCNYVTGTHPICRNCWDRRGETPISPQSPEAQESPKLSESEKSKAEEDERLREFMLLYEQAAPIISTVIKKGADGSPSPPLELMEGLKLRPMLEHAQKLPEPTGIELQEARKEFEQLLFSCVKVADIAAGFVSLEGQAVPSEADLARLATGIETANGLMVRLSQRLASLSQSSGY